MSEGRQTKRNDGGGDLSVPTCPFSRHRKAASPERKMRADHGGHAGRGNSCSTDTGGSTDGVFHVRWAGTTRSISDDGVGQVTASGKPAKIVVEGVDDQNLLGTHGSVPRFVRGRCDWGEAVSRRGPVARCGVHGGGPGG